MKQIFITCLILCLLFMVQHSTKAQATGPQSGDISVAIKFGKAISFSDLSAYELHRSGWVYANNTLPKLQTPSSANFSTENSVTNMIGAEVKYFLTNQIAFRLSGGGSIQSNPSRDAVSGVEDPSGEYDPGTYLPAYSMSEGHTKQQYFLDLGTDYYFSTSTRVNPYAGIQFNGSYAQMELFDGFSGLDNNNEVIPTKDTRKGEAFAWGGSLVGGADYYLAEGFFIGIEIKAFNYMYVGKKIYPQSGMEPQTADNHNWMFLSQPSLKLGFSF
jgi:outer membrane protein W